MYIQTENNEFFEVNETRISKNGTFFSYFDSTGNVQELAIPESVIVPNQDTETAVLDWIVSVDGMWPNGSYIEDAEYNLKIAQAAKFAQIKYKRISLEEGGLATSFGVVDSEPDSQRKISGGVQMAKISLNTDVMIDQDDGLGNIISAPLGQVMFPEGFDVTWRFQDNTERAMTAIEMIQMGVETGKQVAKCQMMKNFLDSQVRAATTVEEVEAIVVDFDWIAYEIPA